MSIAVIEPGERLQSHSSRMWSPSVAFLMYALTFIVVFAWSQVNAATYTATYDVKVGWMKAGEMNTTLLFDSDKYQLEGRIRTMGMFARFLRWQGNFSAVGTMRDGRPHTEVYLVIEHERDDSDKGESKIVITDDESTRIHRTGRESKRRKQPRGEDLMSTLLMLTRCDETLIVHDGEDPYEVHLVREKNFKRINQGTQHYTGPATMCRYQLMYEGRQLRKVDVWLAEVGGRTTPVRIRVRIPLLPDGLMKLRIAAS